VTLSATVAEGTYAITGRCGGGNLGVHATLEIKSLPATGPAIAISSEVAVAAGLVVSGLSVVIAARRSRPGAA
jgi:hypothetical protein